MTDSKHLLLAIFSISFLTACGGGSSGSSDPVVDDSTDDDPVVDDSVADCTTPATELHPAFLEFGDNVEIALSADGCTVVVESDGKPNHVSAYWDPNGSSGLYITPADPLPGDEEFGDPGLQQGTEGAGASTPGYIDEYDGSYTLNASVEPQLAASSSVSSLGAVGIAVSGAPVFNDQEGTGEIDQQIYGSLDRQGAHTGPQVYHYHISPIILSDDDDSLIAIIGDGFFLYGRKCYSVTEAGADGYPTDLDVSGGHTSITQYSEGEEEYHYHVYEELDFIDDKYFVFPGAYQGTPARI